MLTVHILHTRYIPSANLPILALSHFLLVHQDACALCLRYSWQASFEPFVVHFLCVSAGVSLQDQSVMAEQGLLDPSRQVEHVDEQGLLDPQTREDIHDDEHVNFERGAPSRSHSQPRRVPQSFGATNRLDTATADRLLASVSMLDKEDADSYDTWSMEMNMLFLQLPDPDSPLQYAQIQQKKASYMLFKVSKDIRPKLKALKLEQLQTLSNWKNSFVICAAPMLQRKDLKSLRKLLG